ncbi:MAG: transmembrane anchor protein [Polaromonas sp.]|uniref:transmembrane anchor protein n=2 Tax=Polaromonas sp. TaxID=1869339 RepID=UPI0027310DC6|nr:transmembrane anchor protein [Polaromonas sp.]MDP2451792.1 transmembrane anchor protein [Polaromonas sp.]MDP3248743.1 transmembrane anchor protein [Polaromonas sp.]
MYNSDTPLRAELPSSRQLVRSTILAAISALVLLVAVVLPAEYGIDPTGIGRVLRLTEMGDVKQQLAAQAAADAATATSATQSPATGATPGVVTANAVEPLASSTVATAPKETTQAAAPKMEWRDEMPVTLTPGEGTEIKLKMVQGAKAQYSWVVEGGVVNFDTHGDAPGKSISYEKGRGVASDEGVLEAAFTGNHGWYWRNRGKSNVKVILRTRGDYTDIKKMM